MKKSVTAIFTLFVLGNSLFSQWTDQTSNTSSDLNDVHFIDNNKGWAVGRQGAVVATTNGGSTWTAQNSATNKDLNGVYMVNENTGYAVGDNGTVIKYSSGSWSALTSNTTRDLFGVHFIDENTGWFSGDWGQIRKTTNEGSSWVEENNHTVHNNLFNDICMLNANTGWAVGTTGKIVTYNGSNWSTQTSGTSTELLGVHFLNNTLGFAVGKNSEIYMYNGTSWTTHNSGLSSYNIHKVFIVNSNLAFAATSAGFGGTGIILKYNGSVWSKDYEYTGIGTEIFYGIHFPSANKGYVVGAGGLIKSFGTATGIADSGSGITALTLFPNPLIAESKLMFNLSYPSTVSLNISDVSGKMVYSESIRKYPAGNVSIELGNLNLPKGTYIYNLISKETANSGKFIVY